MRLLRHLPITCAALLLFAAPAGAQIVGSYETVGALDGSQFGKPHGTEKMRLVIKPNRQGEMAFLRGDGTVIAKAPVVYRYDKAKSKLAVEVNGERISQPFVEQGDEIQFAGAKWKRTSGKPAAAAPAPTPPAGAPPAPSEAAPPPPPPPPPPPVEKGTVLDPFAGEQQAKKEKPAAPPPPAPPAKTEPEDAPPPPPPPPPPAPAKPAQKAPPATPVIDPYAAAPPPAPIAKAAPPPPPPPAPIAKAAPPPPAPIAKAAPPPPPPPIEKAAPPPPPPPAEKAAPPPPPPPPPPAPHPAAALPAPPPAPHGVSGLWASATDGDAWILLDLHSDGLALLGMLQNGRATTLRQGHWTGGTQALKVRFGEQAVEAPAQLDANHLRWHGVVWTRQ